MMLKIGHFIKRYIYFESGGQRDFWIKLIKMAQGHDGRELQDFYECSNLLLGAGAFGKVFKGISKQTRSPVAIKILNKLGME
jgi:hypothetical protein